MNESMFRDRKDIKNTSKNKESNLSPEASVNLSEDILRGEEKKLTKKLQTIKNLDNINIAIMAGVGLVILAKVFMGENEASQLLPFIGGSVALGSFDKVFNHLSPRIIEKINQVNERIKKLTI